MNLVAKKRKESGSDWLATYSDMVTLLLCFFVLLYSTSSVEQSKWEELVKSVNPNATEISQVVENPDGLPVGEDAVVGGVSKGEHAKIDEGAQAEMNEGAEPFEKLYTELVEYVAENNLEGDIKLTKGEGYTFITFMNNIFFDGDSYIIQEGGKIVLDTVAEAIKNTSQSIREVQILGHTSQASPNIVNELEGDRFLSSNRATEVSIYLQEKNVIEPHKLISSGFGQFRPISSFETRESRALNRRVEIIITEENSSTNQLNEYYEEVYGITVDY